MDPAAVGAYDGAPLQPRSHQIFALNRRRFARCRQCRRNQLGSVHRLGAEINPASVHFLQVQYGVDQALQAFRPAGRHVEQTAGVGRQLHRLVLLQGLDRAGNGRQRRAQFVAHGGNEIILDFFERMALRDVAREQGEAAAAIIKQGACVICPAQFHNHRFYRYFAPRGGQKNAFRQAPVTRRFMACQIRGQILHHARAQALGGEVCQGLAGHVCRRAVKQPRCRRIDQADGTGVIKNHHRIDRRIPDDPIDGFAGAGAAAQPLKIGAEPANPGQRQRHEQPLQPLGTLVEVRTVEAYGNNYCGVTHQGKHGECGVSAQIEADR